MDINWYTDEDTDEEIDEMAAITDYMLATMDASLEAQLVIEPAA